MSYKTTIIFFILLCVGILIIYSFTSNKSNLPNHGSINPFIMNNIHGDFYNLENDKLKIVTFFYTNCPDICPMTFMQISKLQGKLKGENIFGTEIDILSITLDPEFDTPTVIKNYGKNFQADTDGWYWLRDSEDSLREVANQFKVVYKKAGDGMVSHSTTIYLLDGHNYIRGIYSMSTAKTPMDIDQMMEDILMLQE